MATIVNKKVEALSINDIKNKFSNGITVHECSKGICLISGIKFTHECGCQVMGCEDEWWWVDMSPVIGEKLDRKRYRQYDFEMDRVGDEINKKLFSIEPPIRAYS